MTNVGRIIAAEIAWPIEIVAGQNDIAYSMVVSGVPLSFTVSLTPGTYWSHKLKVGLPSCFATHVAQRIQAVTGYTTTAQRAIATLTNGTLTAPAMRFTHSLPSITAASILALDPATTVPLDLLGWHYNDSALNQWSEHMPAGSFIVVDGGYSTAFRRARVVEWRPTGRASMQLSSSSPDAIRSVSDVHRLVEFEASGVAAPFINDGLMTHAATLIQLFGNIDLAESEGSSLNNLFNVDPDNLRYYVQLDNSTSGRHWWAPCRIDGEAISNFASWRSDEPGYPGEHHRVRIPLRLTADMTRVI